jgi:type I restriction enzyme M protein
LEGNRRAGKTSILKRLQQTNALPDWIPVYLQLQGAQGQDRRIGLPDREIFYNIARELILALHKAGRTIGVPGVGPITPELPSPRVGVLLRDKLRGEFAKDNSFELLKLIVEESIDAARPKRLLLMLDEFDKVQEGIENGVTNPQVMDNLRFLFQNYSRLSGALVGLRRLRRVREDYWSALFGFGIVKSVGALERREAIELITHPVATRLIFPPSVCERILFLTACQPFLIQYLCQLIFEESAVTGERSITMKMVDMASELMTDVGEHFKHLWDEAETERRRFLVSLVDRLTGGPDHVTFDLLSETLPLEGFEYSDLSLLADDLDILREQEILTLEEGKTYRLALPLLSMWIKKHVDALMLRQRAKHEQESGGV